MQSIESIIIYPTSDGNHVTTHVCQGICTNDGEDYTIQLLKTKKWFDELKFHPMPGDQLSAPETNRDFTITDVTIAAKRPKYVTVAATLNNKSTFVHEPKATGGLAS